MRGYDETTIDNHGHSDSGSGIDRLQRLPVNVALCAVAPRHAVPSDGCPGRYDGRSRATHDASASARFGHSANAAPRADADDSAHFQSAQVRARRYSKGS